MDSFGGAAAASHLLLAKCCDWRPGSESCWLKHFRRPPEPSRRYRGPRWLLRALVPWRRPWENHWKTMGRAWEKHLLWWSLHVHVSLLEDNLFFHQTLILRIDWGKNLQDNALWSNHETFNVHATSWWFLVQRYRNILYSYTRMMWVWSPHPSLRFKMSFYPGNTFWYNWHSYGKWQS